MTPSDPAAPALAPGDRFVHTTPDDPRSQVVLDQLSRLYDELYHAGSGEPSAEIGRYPTDRFSAPEGTFLLLIRAGRTISAGAFMTIEDPSGVRTAEIKRVWTDPVFRGQGLARLVLAELEAEAAARGFRRIMLSTGPRQPDAVRLYLATGYRPLFDPSADPETVGSHGFSKDLPARAPAEPRPATAT